MNEGLGRRAFPSCQPPCVGRRRLVAGGPRPLAGSVYDSPTARLRARTPRNLMMNGFDRPLASVL